MLEIDGSFGESGGQVVRPGTPVRCTRIRAGCSAGSGTPVFDPGAIRRTAIVLEIGTAGSVPLVLQAWLPVALACGGSITVTGGTGVEKGPTIDYCTRVFVPLFRAHGAGCAVEVQGRSHYPAGGGAVHAAAEPSAIARIDPARVPADPGIVSCTQNLPDHMAERQAAAASAVLPGYPVALDRRTGWSAGAKGSSALGRPGLPAERVGRAAAEGLRAALSAPGLSSHALTVCRLLSLFDHEIAVSGRSPAVFSA
ncbi:MAG: 3-terminal phosphate cyclase [Methanofollis sp.]|nr:3-terminal phosphate cyclase [Methanofollis sp.]